MKSYGYLITGICLGIWLTTIPAQAGIGGSYGLEFLKLGGGARILGMGEAFVGLADDASAIFYNPAGLAQINFPEILSMYNRWFLEVNHQIAAVAYPTPFGIIALGYSGLSSGNIQSYNASGEVGATFNTSSSSLSLAFGRKINPNLSWGLCLKSVGEKLEETNGSTLAFDFGLHYRVNPFLTLGASALNLGSGIKFISETTALPTSYRLGAAYSGKFLDENFILSGDFLSYSDGTKLNLGLEYLIRNFFALRFGSSAGNLRAGIGILASLFSFDYAYLAHPDLGATHQASLSLLFGAEEKTKKMLLEKIAQGKAYLNQKKYADAYLLFEKVVNLDPKNEEAAILMRKAQVELERETFEKVFAEVKVEKERSLEEIIASGKNFMDQGKYLEALAEFAKVLKIEPTNREALKLQNEAQYKMESKLIETAK
ncbi:MAG: PorV/PorQ family protein, partial [Candidatus Margulisiibacteriota bacterium]